MGVFEDRQEAFPSRSAVRLRDFCLLIFAF
jgi:hypothetical protein